MNQFKKKDGEEKLSRQNSPLSLLLRMWHRRCARLARFAVSVSLLVLLALTVLCISDLEQLCQEGKLQQPNNNPQELRFRDTLTHSRLCKTYPLTHSPLECMVESLTSAPSADSPFFIQYIAEEVLDLPLSNPPAPLSLEEPNGTYVEVGSGDGEWFSLSSYLDIALGWSGLLVEPRKNEYDQARRRRKAAGANVCVSITLYHSKRYFWEPRNDHLPDTLKKISSASSTLAEFVTKEDMEDGETYLVQCFTLNALLHAYTRTVLHQNRPQITLLIIDVHHGIQEMLDSLKSVQITMLLLRISSEQDMVDLLELHDYTRRPSLLMKSHALFVHKDIEFVYKTEMEE
ncbi:hypothetical protein FHG87_007454 [Trinorchestia longiramus]|nr:hypothetical protein FHG87_007454 [Trinorchestia longiramus]